MRPKLGIINIAMEVYPHQLADPLLDSLMVDLGQDANVTYLGKAFDADTAREKAIKIRGMDLDLAVVFLSTWVDATVAMAALLELENVPTVLWGLPMFDGSSTGSLVGLAVVKGSLEQMGRRADFVYGLPETAAQSILGKAKINAVARNLRRQKIGLFGYASMGMYTATFDHANLRAALGPEVLHVDNYALVRSMEALPDDAVRTERQAMLKKLPLSSPDLDEPFTNAVKMRLALKEIIAEEKLDAVSLKCQHEISRTYGCTCIPLAFLVEDGLPATCEGDVPGLVTAMMLRALTEKPAFFCDFINAEEDNVWFSSCGFIAPSLTEGKITVKRQIHEIGEQGAIISAAPKKGDVTIARLAQRPAGKYAMHLASGTVEEGYLREHIYADGSHDHLFPIARVKLPYPSTKFLSDVVSNHYLLTWADCREDLGQLCRVMGIEMIV